MTERDWVDHHGKYRLGPPPLDGFLLARFAEDEALWKLAADAEAAFVVGDGVPAVQPRDFSRRMLADVEAKRRIVERLAPITEADDGCVCDRCMTLRDLTLPYANHADYQPDWKP